MHLKDPLELYYLGLMLRWERTAPPDRRQGLLDNKPVQNSQISRIAHVLKMVAAGTQERAYSTLARFTRRRDGESYISKNFSWMEAPYLLSEGWYFEGGTSLQQKQSFLQHLTKLGLSASFVACADDFVACKTIEKYLPTDKEQEEILKIIQASEMANAALC